ncbi:MAG: L-ribulose-5-phosphate 4-epimerase AraD [Verrucomicrobiia bacterium]
MSTEFITLKEACCQANRRLPATGLVDLTFGNVSVLGPNRDLFAIKPSGVPYADLTPADIVLVSVADGRIVEGHLRPSSDTPTHRRLYQAFTSARAVVHTHSRRAVAFAQAGRPIPCLGTTHADYFRGDIPVTRHLTAHEVAGDYEWATGEVIVERFQELDPEAVPAVLVRSHGPFTWGPNPDKAVENAEALEIVAGLALDTLRIEPTPPPIPEPLLERHFSRKHGPNATYGQIR